MGIRLDGDGDTLSRTVNLPSSAGFSLMMFARINVDRDSWQTFICMEENVAERLYILGTDSDGVSLALYNGSTSTIGSSLGVGVWHHLGWSVDVAGAGNSKVYLDGVNVFTVESFGVSIARIALGDVYAIGGSGEWLAGSMCGFLYYDAVLSAAEFLQQSKQIAPVRTVGLNTFTGLLSAGDYVNYSGANTAAWTVGGTISSDDNPPVSWRSAWRRRVYTVPAAVVYTATLSSSMPLVSGVVKRVGKVVGGTVVLTSLVRKVGRKSLNSGITAVSSVRKGVSKTLSGSVVTSSSIRKVAVKAFSGVGVMATVISTSATRSLTLASSMVMGSAVTKRVEKGLSGSIAVSSTVSKRASRAFGSGITAVSTVRKVGGKVLNNSVVASSGVVKRAGKVLSGSITALSSVATRATKSVVLSSTITMVSSITTSFVEGVVQSLGSLLPWVRRRRKR